MSKLKSLTILTIAAFGLAACETLESVSGLGGGDDFAAGSSLEGRLSSADRSALGAAFIKALDSGQAQAWRGKRATGVVTPGDYALANLKADPKVTITLAHGDLDYGHVMETELGLFVLTRNSNIRLGPGTQNKVAEVLPSGSGVEVVGEVVDKSWMLVAVDDKILGYAYRDLLIKAPGTELELAGGPRRRPILCREYSQRANIFSSKENWTGVACNDGAGWRVVRMPPAPPGPTLLEEELL